MKVAMIDYGRGNLRSVERALEKAGAEVKRVESGEGLQGVETVVYLFQTLMLLTS